jgi:transposase-like protein/general stress protein YciG
MDKEQALPKTLLEAVSHFSFPENCHEFMVNLRWPDGVVRCPQCGSDNVSYLPNARVFKCYEKHPRQKFSLKVGTIFEDSPIGLEKWLPVMWMLVNCKNGISSWEISRAIGVTQKSAWFMLQRCRLAMQDELTGGMLGGEVEVDETYIGGKARNMHKDRKERAMGGKKGGPASGSKTIVAGMLQRGGKVVASVVADRGKETMQSMVRGNVEPGTQIYSDEHGRNWKMEEYLHDAVNHLDTYVCGNVHTNGMENFWSLLKRTIGGTYVSVEPFHLFRYVDEQAFRFNNRKPMDDGDRFVYAMRKIVGKRLTWDELIGKTETPPCEEPF